MSQRYVHVFNFETKTEQKKAKEFLEIMPSAKIEPYGIIGQKEHREWDKSWCSLWVPEEFFMIAWTYFSYHSLKNRFIELEDGFFYFDMQRNEEDFIMYVSNDQ